MGTIGLKNINVITCDNLESVIDTESPLIIDEYCHMIANTKVSFSEEKLLPAALRVGTSD